MASSMAVPAVVHRRGGGGWATVAEVGILLGGDFSGGSDEQQQADNWGEVLSGSI